MNDVTIIFYTSNDEDESFEKKIRDNILKQSNGIKIISVSRKPIDFGHNICIGEQPVCYTNCYRQLITGLKAAKTKFCLACESDVLYPPEYFKFIPPVEDKVYRYTNLYIYWKNKGKFWRKGFSEGCQICGRKFWIDSIEKQVTLDNWKELPYKTLPLVFTTRDEYSWTGNPAITFKTGHGVSQRTGYKKEKPLKELPYWGEAKFIHNKMFL